MQENFHGSQQKVNVLERNMLKAKDNQEKYSEHSPKIIPSLKRRLNSPLPLPDISQTPNGNKSLGENLSTSTTSLAHSTTLPLLKRALDISEELRFLLERQNQPIRSKLVETGLQHGSKPHKQPHTSSSTKQKNYSITERNEFLFLYSAFLLPDGVNSARACFSDYSK